MIIVEMLLKTSRSVMEAVLISLGSLGALFGTTSVPLRTQRDHVPRRRRRQGGDDDDDRESRNAADERSSN
eukprot:8678324-Pyramimonas_sp.AAC.1